MAKFCKKCNKFLELNNFYKTKNTKSYIDGFIDWCKTCLKQYRTDRKEQKKQLEILSIKNFYVEKKEIIMIFD